VYWRAWDKTIAISFSLGAAGILTCAAILIDSLLPTASVVAVAAWMVVLGAAVGMIVAGYVWLCDKCQDYLSERLGRWFRTELWEPRAKRPSEEPPAIDGPDRQPSESPPPQTARNGDRQVEAPYGVARWRPLVPPWPRAARWRGQ